MPSEYRLIGVKRWLRRRASARRMRRVDGRPIPTAPDEIRLFIAVRDEMLRLPYFLEYYRGLGVERFFFVDNASSDGTLEFLREQQDTHVFETSETYTRQESWIDHLLRRYGRDRWCVVVDVDELLVQPGHGRASLRDLCRYLDEGDYDALPCLLLDMYPAGKLGEARYRPGTDPLEAAPLFEPASHYRVKFDFHRCRNAPAFRHAGGMRERVFGLKTVCCSKFPLVRFRRPVFVRQGTHAVEGAHLADVQGVLMHFKFLADFGPRVVYEADRGEHWDDASQYKSYANKVESDPELTLRCEQSVRYEGPEQLRTLGLIESSERFDRFVASGRA